MADLNDLARRAQRLADGADRELWTLVLKRRRYCRNFGPDRLEGYG